MNEENDEVFFSNFQILHFDASSPPQSASQASYIVP